MKLGLKKLPRCYPQSLRQKLQRLRKSTNTSILNFLVSVFLLAITAINPLEDKWYLKQDYINIGLFAVVSWLIARRSHITVGVAVFCVGIATVTQFALHKGLYIDWQAVRLSIRYVNAERFYSYFMGIIFLVFIPRAWIGTVISSLPLYGLGVLIFNIYTYSISFPAHGILTNWSLSGAWAVCLYPFLHAIHPYFFLPLLIASTLVTFSSIPLGLVCCFAMLLMVHNKINWALAVAGLGMGVLMYMAQGEFLFESSGRFYVWYKVLEVFLSSDKILTGIGAGSLVVSMANPVTMERVKEPNAAWTDLHNDWLNVFVSSGLIGLVAVSVCVLWIIIRHYKLSNIALFQSSVLISVMALASFPAHLPVVCLISGAILLSAYKLERKDS